jgi:acid phosphatase (class A)
MEQGRTPAQKAAAEFDDKDEDMFLYANVLGVGFNADALPLTAALSAHLRNDVSIVNGPLKARFGRPRPYHFDHTLHPICETNKENSYPSGHAFNGYAYGLTLAEMVPEKSAEILARADAYARNRMVCEAHYASDLEASRRAAYALFGYLEGNARFQAELTAARTETRRALHLEDGQASQLRFTNLSQSINTLVVDFSHNPELLVFPGFEWPPQRALTRASRLVE